MPTTCYRDLLSLVDKNDSYVFNWYAFNDAVNTNGNVHRGFAFRLRSFDNSTWSANLTVQEWYNINTNSIVDCGVTATTVPQSLWSSTNVNYVVNLQMLNNVGNNVVHKSGEENITGNKNFLAAPRVRGLMPQVFFDKQKKADGTLDSLWSNPLQIRIVDADNTVHDRYFAFQNNMILGNATENILWLKPVDVNGDPLSGKECAFHQKVNRTNDDISYCWDFAVTNASNDTKILLRIDSGENAVRTGASNDGLIKLGDSGARWSEVYAANGAIQTSDRNYKVNIIDIPDVVLQAWGEVKFKQYQMKDSYQKKGNNARIHFGVIAQECAEALRAKGLDPERYGFYCYDRWDDQYEDIVVVDKEAVYGDVKVIDAQAIVEPIYDENMNEIGQREVSPEKFHMENREIEPAVTHTEKKLVKAAGEIYSVRPEECLYLECAYQRWRLDQLEVRLG